MNIDRQRIERGGFILFLALITIGLIAVISGFLLALLWAGLAAILFRSLFQWLLEKTGGRRNLAAGLTMLIITFAVVVPTLLIGSMVVDQASGVYMKMRSGQIDFAQYFQQVRDALPNRLRQAMDSSGVGSFEGLQSRISRTLSSSVSQIATQALSIGRNAFAFALAFGVGLYVAFFLIRDGDRLGPDFVRALPLDHGVAKRLVETFVAVVRATIKGSVIVGLVQGGLGAITFWIVGLPAALLWGLLMAIAALLPAIGPAIIWGPVAIYLLATGAIWQGAVVVASGVLVIGLADNILRPILVGRDTGLPDWIVLLTTLGGIELLGLSGIVVGPVVAALFLAGWRILSEERGVIPPAGT
ncbi:AI-2E family transporter [Sphingomonas sanguinis]|uniref:AI-2E family transporter n=1 Tax=Sphingomonas sp. LC-1 TaxID=3110957 RepID=UPI0021BB2125|nr:AI-2E family transporter [Sphingomonas sp. LC-1]MCT8001075.1 AI-2E family transporter [Sphingomonas sp. LC-1]